MTRQPHSDGRNFILTAHLGVDVPSDGCWIRYPKNAHRGFSRNGIPHLSFIAICSMISVAGEKRSWAQDRAIVFDTSFTHRCAPPALPVHRAIPMLTLPRPRYRGSTGNESDKDRYVLIIDFWHPELTAPERCASCHAPLGIHHHC